MANIYCSWGSKVVYRLILYLHIYYFYDLIKPMKILIVSVEKGTIVL